MKNIWRRLLMVLQEELLNSFSRILYDCLWIFKIFYSGMYTMVICHEQCIFIIYDSAGRERNNIQQLPKLIKLTHFILIFHFYTPWKRQKTKRFFWRFQCYKNGTLGWNGLKFISIIWTHKVNAQSHFWSR